MTKRILSALVMVAILFPLLLIGKVWFALAMIVVAILSINELFDIKGSKKEIPFPIKIISFILMFFFIITASDQNTMFLSLEYKYIAAMMIALYLPLILYHNDRKYTINDANYVIAILLFIGTVFNLIIVFRNIRLAYIIYLLTVTISSDTFAHLAGSLIGKHKLSTNISPNKTVEGAVYGFFMATVLSSAFYLVVLDPTANILLTVAMSGTLSLAAIFGDLIFSSIKRYYKQKDYGHLIPGHGGVLDRIDSLIFVVLAFALFASLL